MMQSLIKPSYFIYFMKLIQDLKGHWICKNAVISKACLPTIRAFPIGS